MHSEKFLWRKNNPYGLSKPEAEHIEHFMQRMLERFNIIISIGEYYAIINDIQNNKARHIYSTNSSNGIFSINLHGQEVWVMYGGVSDDIPARLKTAIRPHDQFILPDALSHVYNQTSFSKAVYEVIEQFKQLSEQIDLNDKKIFFMTSKAHPVLKKGALMYKQYGENCDKLHFYSMAIRHLIRENQVKV